MTSGMIIRNYSSKMVLLLLLVYYDIKCIQVPNYHQLSNNYAIVYNTKPQQ
jgi:hypothetical protein